MARFPRRSLTRLILAVTLCACASPYEQGERLYRHGDLRGALEVWRTRGEPGDARIQERLPVVEGEFERLLRRYAKRAQFFEERGRLAEAVLYYRLALKLEPDQPELLERIQGLARVLEEKARQERAALERALMEGRMADASRHAEELERLDPLDPAVQIELRQVRAALGSEVQRHLDVGKEAFAAGNRSGARRAFRSALELAPQNETALGYISYLRRFDALDRRPAPRPAAPPTASDAVPASRAPGPAPAEPLETISQEEILAEGHFHAGEQLEAKGQPYRAIGEYQAALRINPRHGRARRRLERVRDGLRGQIDDLYESGKSYFQDEDLPNALRVWRQVLLIDPGHQRTRENVERAERMLSRLEEIQSGGR